MGAQRGIWICVDTARFLTPATDWGSSGSYAMSLEWLTSVTRSHSRGILAAANSSDGSFVLVGDQLHNSDAVGSFYIELRRQSHPS